ncbi:PadR family transcriptional regulator [Lentibacillus kapialis]|uniref:PadR family transcriptional regulator n=1 Tax=Lentibacillus kapialis TaxID=340214 RepID=A0A917UVW7_9BACI|nr:PadR family transcriptional regulator [Lentibacillus kapialis]
MIIISRSTVYGYELSMKLQDYGLTVSEGSIYPVLLRMQKDDLIKGNMQPSPNGPNRKYYHLTDKGVEALDLFKTHWEGIKHPVDRLLQDEGDRT